MSMSPEPGVRTDDRLIRQISLWLARHIGNAELRRGIEEIGSEGLAPGGAEAVAELAEWARAREAGRTGRSEMIARETLESLAQGE